MTLRSNIVYFVLSSTLLISACENNEQNVSQKVLDLKGFQIIRQKDDGTALSLSIADTQTKNELFITDQIGAGAYPTGAILTSQVKCTEDRKDSSKGQFEKVTESRFHKPVSLLQILPEEVLSRAHARKVNSLKCDIQLSAADNVGNRYILTKTLSGVVRDILQSTGIQITHSKDSLMLSPENIAVLKTSELENYAFESLTDGFQFDQHKMICEKFELEKQNFGISQFLDLKRIDFSRATYIQEKSKSETDLQNTPIQYCRSLFYLKDELVALSPYFLYQQKSSLPEKIFLTTSSNSEKVESSLFNTLNQFDLSNAIVINEYSDQIQFESELNCFNKYTNKLDFSLKSEKPFTAPIQLATLFPLSVLFQSNEQHAHRVCKLYISLKDNLGSSMTLDFPIEGTLLDSARSSNVDIKENGVNLLSQNSDLPTVNSDQLYQYSLDLKDGKTFNSFQLTCDYFEYTTVVDRTDSIDLRRIDVSKANYKSSDIETLNFLKVYPHQKCRIFVFGDNQLLGYSTHFIWIQNHPKPEISFDPSTQVTFMGTYNFGPLLQQWIQLGDMVISNPGPVKMVVGIAKNDRTIAFQIEEIQAENTVEYQSPLVYDSPTIYSDVLDIGGVDIAGDALRYFTIPAGKNLRLRYYIKNIDRCVSDRGNNLGMHGYVGQLLGMYFKLYFPRVELILPNQALNFESVLSDGVSYWSQPKTLAYQNYLFANEQVKMRRPGKQMQEFRQVSNPIDVCKNNGSPLIDLR